ncbi:hypothetical protein [Tenacibaculum amylolyticum]|uniref:hypothetical protein n=1 Tax=Tenacibaculum amylolyticum TaxID=104269 RepID=UPI003895AB5A
MNTVYKLLIFSCCLFCTTACYTQKKNTPSKHKIAKPTYAGEAYKESISPNFMLVSVSIIKGTCTNTGKQSMIKVLIKKTIQQGSSITNPLISGTEKCLSINNTLKQKLPQNKKSAHKESITLLVKEKLTQDMSNTAYEIVEIQR